MFAGLEATTSHPRRWTTPVSFTLQAMLVGAALIAPLLRPTSLSDAFTSRRIFLPAPVGDQAPQPNPRVNNRVATNAPVFPIPVRMGPAVQISDVGQRSGDNTQAPSIGILNGEEDIQNILDSSHSQAMPTRPQAPAARAAMVSRMMEGNLIHKVEPRYPAIAVQMGIQGTVLIRGLISREGTVENPRVISGPPFLAAAALEAVKEWRYRPYYLNGQPVEVETEITVNFVLNR